jgi:hypothetical protein
MSFNAEEILISAIMLPASLALIALSIRNFVVDFKFYRKNNWDFEKDSGVKIRQGYGNSGRKFSARERLLYGHLFFLTIGCLLTFISMGYLFPYLEKLLFM